MIASPRTELPSAAWGSGTSVFRRLLPTLGEAELDLSSLSGGTRQTAKASYSQQSSQGPPGARGALATTSPRPAPRGGNNRIQSRVFPSSTQVQKSRKGPCKTPASCPPASSPQSRKLWPCAGRWGGVVERTTGPRGLPPSLCKRAPAAQLSEDSSHPSGPSSIPWRWEWGARKHRRSPGAWGGIEGGLRFLRRRLACVQASLGHQEESGLLQTAKAEDGAGRGWHSLNTG